MWGLEHRVEDQRRGLAVRARAAASAIRDWAATDVGGWSLIGGLAAAAALGLSLLLVGPAIERARTAAAPAVRLTGEPQALDPTALTVDDSQLQDIGPEQARLWNAAIPFSTQPNPAARPFVMLSNDLVDQARALDCLTAAVYYEAGSETAAGQAAVAQVVLNRVRHPAFPKTVCGVVFQGSERSTGCQFTFTCDGALARLPSPAGWARARATATAALGGLVEPKVGNATHYHTDWVAPYWAPKLIKAAQIGTHIFYRWPGVWGRPASFVRAYAGGEPEPAKMLALATPVLIEAVDVADAIEVAAVTPIIDRPAPLIIPEPLGAVDDRSAAPAAEAIAPEAAAPAAAPRPEPSSPVIADPLQNPVTARPARRTRIAAPSGW